MDRKTAKYVGVRGPILAQTVVREATPRLEYLLNTTTGKAVEFYIEGTGGRREFVLGAEVDVYGLMTNRSSNGMAQVWIEGTGNSRELVIGPESAEPVVFEMPWLINRTTGRRVQLHVEGVGPEREVVFEEAEL